MQLPKFNTVHLGPCEPWLRSLPGNFVDLTVADVPYSSGGFTRSDRMQPVSEKYTNSGQELEWEPFLGDSRDQRAFGYWCTQWMAECYRTTKWGGYGMCFTDWRQLPTVTDAFQAAGWQWRGIIVWNKGRGARAANTAYFKHQAEFIVWGSKGPLPRPGLGPFDGVFEFRHKQSDKHHLTGKPVDLLRELVRVVPVGAVVNDPFMGSFTTAAACAIEGRQYIGAEESPIIYARGEQRLQLVLDDLRRKPKLINPLQREAFAQPLPLIFSDTAAA
jgi:site-specific DNA-methyltransferase (adenine-specific)